MALPDEFKNEPEVVVRKLFANLGVVSIPEDGLPWPCFIGVTPTGDRVPDKVISLRQVASRLQSRIMSTGETEHLIGLNFNVRSDDMNNGYRKAKGICNALDNNTTEVSVQVGYSLYMVHSISRQSDVIPLGFEVPESKRKVWGVEALASISYIDTVGTA